MQRRRFAQVATWLGVGAAAGRSAHAKTSTHSGAAGGSSPVAEPNKASADTHHQHAIKKYESLTGGDKLVIGMLVYPSMFLQDLIGPLTVFESLMNKEIHLLWKDTEPVGNEPGQPAALVPVKPTTAFKDCPRQLDVLFVPGGVPGTLTVMEDPEVLAFLADQGARARYVTSVCTGSLILGAAGLLKGYRAASYWATRDVLRDLGAIPSRQRVVMDRNRITGGGVTAGIDFGLSLIAKLRSPAYAKTVQLYLEYDPQPPFDAGSPEKAPRIAREFLTEMYAELVRAARATAHRAMARLR
jgi:cyclohexyl-isocyanide hydratase